MAKNTYKKKKEEKEEKKSKINLDFVRDRKFQLFIGFFLLLSSIFLVVSFISYLKHGQADQSVVEAFLDTSIKESGTEVRNVFGLIGAVASHYFIFLWFGIASLLIPPLLFTLGYRIVWNRVLITPFRAFNFTIFYLLWTSLLMGYFLINQEETTFWGFLSGGIGFELAIVLESLMGWGALLFIIFLFLTFNMYFFNITQIPALNRVGEVFNNLFDQLATAIPTKKEKEEKVDITSVLEQVRSEVKEEDENRDESETWIVKKVPPAKEKKTQPKPDPEFTIDLPPSTASRPQEEPKVEAPKPEPARVPVENTAKPIAPPSPKPKEEVEDLSFEVEQKEFAEEEAVQQVNFDPTLDLSSYKFPTPNLLIDYPDKDIQVSKDELEQNKDRIIETLVNFKIGISSIKATIGPTVTLYEIVPEAGVKISKIKNLEDDIALSLAALGIRIIAPIPGKGTIGIEVPNKNREMVDVKSVITTSKFMESKMELPVVLGKTISNLLRKPH